MNKKKAYKKYNNCQVCDEKFKKEKRVNNRKYCGMQCVMQAQIWDWIKECEKQEIKRKKFIRTLNIQSFETMRRYKRPESIKSGLYFLFDNNILKYIGSSKDIMIRIAQHGANKGCLGTTNKEWDSYSFILYPFNKKLRKIETALINKYKPEYNIQQTLI